jgi:protein CpxP
MKIDWRKYLVASFILATAAIANGVTAEGLDGPPGADGPAGMQHGFGDPARLAEHLTRRLDLDDAQAQSLRNIIEAAQPEMTDLRDRSRQNQEAIRSLDPTAPEYDASLSNLARENGELATAATLLHGRLRAEINAVLTPEQQQKLADDADHRESWHHRRRR